MGDSLWNDLTDANESLQKFMGFDEQGPEIAELLEDNSIAHGYHLSPYVQPDNTANLWQPQVLVSWLSHIICLYVMVLSSVSNGDALTQASA